MAALTACRLVLLGLAGLTMPRPMAAQWSSLVRAAAFLKKLLSLEKAISMGLKSGL